MNTFRMLASPRVWGPILGVVVVLALIFYAYLAAVTSPQENLKDLPIALVNEDRGTDLAGEDVNLGDRIVENVTNPDSPAAGTVDWKRHRDRGCGLVGDERAALLGRSGAGGATYARGRSRDRRPCKGRRY